MSKISDKEKLTMVLESLGVNANSLATKLGYKNPMSVYSVLKDEDDPAKRPLGEKLIDRIISHYPQVNHSFLINGELPVLLSRAQTQVQKNVFGLENEIEDPEVAVLKKLLSLPNSLSSIAISLERIADAMEQKKTSQE